MTGSAPALAAAEALLREGRHAEAEAWLQRHCQEAPEDPRGWYLLGAVRHLLGRPGAALEAFERAASLDPDDVQALGAGAAMLTQLGRLPEALDRARRALARAPDDPGLLANTALLLEDSGEPEAALEHYDRALAGAPELREVLQNRGALLGRLGRHAEALADGDRLVAHYPQLAEGHFNRAESLLALRRWPEALAACEEALRIAPGYVPAHLDRGLVLSVLGEVEQARAAFDEARRLDPGAMARFRNPLEPRAEASTGRLDPREIYLAMGFERLERCDWSDREPYARRFEQWVHEGFGTEREIRERGLAFASLSVPLPADTRFALAQSIARGIAGWAVSTGVRFEHPRRRGSRLRIGYLSPNFREHANAVLTGEIYGLHDRDRFEVFGYSIHPGDGSAARRNIERDCDVFRELSGVDDAEAARIIHADGIHVLIDLAGYLRYSRSEILALRPAPVQATHLGMPSSLGGEFVDYRLCSRVSSPFDETQPGWSERLVYLPHTEFTYDTRRVAGDAPPRAALGLPEDGFVFCCFNNSHKIEPQVFDIWTRLLAQVPGSVLWFEDRAPGMRENLRREAARRGVDPDRLVFAGFEPWERHVPRYRAADLFLDTFLYNAHTVACDALRAGLPVLTCPGNSNASRSAAGIVTAAGLPELVTESPAAYEELALRLATRPGDLAALRARLARQGRTAPLFDTPRAVRHFERAYELMWERHAVGDPPAPFSIVPLS